MNDCRCMTPPFDYRDYESEPVGVDETKGRYGEVTIQTCRHCGALWLRYLVEYEAFSRSGRWYRGLVSADQLTGLFPEDAPTLLEALPWYFYGGSYFDSTGRKGAGKVKINL